MFENEHVRQMSNVVNALLPFSSPLLLILFGFKDKIHFFKKNKGLIYIYF